MTVKSDTPLTDKLMERQIEDINASMDVDDTDVIASMSRQIKEIMDHARQMERDRAELVHVLNNLLAGVIDTAEIRALLASMKEKS